MTQTLTVLFLLCAAANALNLFRLFRHKQAKGVSFIAIALFTVTSVVQSFYFHDAGDTTLLVGSLAMAAVNLIWLMMAIYYRYLEEWNSFLDQIPLDF